MVDERPEDSWSGVWRAMRADRQMMARAALLVVVFVLCVVVLVVPW
jgi:hypothetical protein